MQKENQKAITEKQDNLATFGVEDISTIEINKENLKVVDGKEYYKNNPSLDTPTFFSTQRD